MSSPAAQARTAVLDRLEKRMKADCTITGHAGLSGDLVYPCGAQSLRLSRSTPLPAQVRDALREDMGRDEKDRNFHMAETFPEIHRAVFSSGRNLYIWNYTAAAADDLIWWTVAEGSGDILATALLRPGPGEFHEDVTHVLIVATQCNVFMLEMNFDQGLVDGKLFITQSEFSIDTASQGVCSLLVTPDQRIFAGGRDGQIYTITWETSWFRRAAKMQRVQSWTVRIMAMFSTSSDAIVELRWRPSSKHNSSPLLFALTRDGYVEAFHVDASNSLSSIEKTTHLFDKAAIWYDKNQVRDPGVVMNIKRKGIEVFGKDQVVAIYTNQGGDIDSEDLVIVTKNLHRIFIKASSKGISIAFVELYPARVHERESDREIGEYLRDSPADPLELDYLCRPTVAYRALYRDGLLLVANVSSRSSDVLGLVRGHEKHPATSIEKHSLNSVVYSINEDDTICEDSSVASALKASPDSTALVGLSVFSTQALFPRRKFILITETEVRELTLDTPLDQFVRLLTQDQFQGISTNFLRKFPLEEALAMALTLACGAHELQFLSSTFSSPFHPSQRRTLASTHASGVDPTSSYESNALRIRSASLFWRSACHSIDTVALVAQAIDRVFSRIVAPIWETTLADLCVTAEFTDGFQGDGNGSKSELVSTIQRWSAQLYSFLSSEDMHVWRRGDAIEGRESRTYDAAIKSVAAVDDVLRRVIDVLQIAQALIRQPNAFRLLRVTPDTTIARLNELEVKHLVEREDVKEICRKVVHVIMQDNPSDLKWVRQLQAQCPELVRADDMDVYTANEILHSLSSRVDGDKSTLVHEAVELYKRAAMKRDFPVNSVRESLKDNQFYAEFVEVALSRARLLENRRVTGVDTVKDTRALQKQCYTSILGLIGNLWLSSVDGISAHEQRDLKLKISRVIEGTSDARFCSEWFGWLSANGFSDEISTFQTDLVEEYLAQSRDFMQLIPYFSRHHKFDKGSIKCMELAQRLYDSHAFPVTLAQRISLLKNGIEFAKSHDRSSIFPDSSNKTRVFEFRRVLDAAEIQSSILKAVLALEQSTSVIADVVDLQQKLLSQSQLKELATKYALHEVMLDIHFVTKERMDYSTLKSTWNHILDPSEPVSRIRGAVLTIGSKYHTLESLFPLQHILGRLCIVFANTCPIPASAQIPSEPLRLMLDIGVSSARLIRAAAEILNDCDKSNSRLILQIALFTVQACERQVSEFGRSHPSMELIHLVKRLLDDCEMLSRPQGHLSQDVEVERLMSSIAQLISHLRELLSRY